MRKRNSDGVREDLLLFLSFPSPLLRFLVVRFPPSSTVSFSKTLFACFLIYLILLPVCCCNTLAMIIISSNACLTCEYAKRWTSNSSGTKFHSIGRLAVNTEPAICNGHLPYLWGWCWREGRVGNWTQGVGRGGFEHFVFTSWLIGSFDWLLCTQLCSGFDWSEETAGEGQQNNKREHESDDESSDSETETSIQVRVDAGGMCSLYPVYSWKIFVCHHLLHGELFWDQRSSFSPTSAGCP